MGVRRVRSYTDRDRGSMSVELVGFVPALVLITLLLAQGFLAAAAVSATQSAARDGARAASLGQDVHAAVHAAVPDWIRVEGIDRYACDGACVSVEVRIPIGLPGVTSSNVTVERSAEFPDG